MNSAFCSAAPRSVVPPRNTARFSSCTEPCTLSVPPALTSIPLLSQSISVQSVPPSTASAGTSTVFGAARRMSSQRSVTSPSSTSEGMGRSPPPQSRAAALETVSVPSPVTSTQSKPSKQAYSVPPPSTVQSPEMFRRRMPPSGAVRFGRVQSAAETVKAWYSSPFHAS